MLRTAIKITMLLGFTGVLGSLPALQSQALSQEPGQQATGPSRFAGMQRIGGEVTAISGATVTVKAEDGTTYQIVTTDNTRLMKGRGVTLTLSDLKVGDGVMAMGNLDAPAKTLHAAMLVATDGAQLREQRANLGKTFIMGKVTAIDLDNAKMTIERPDNVSQTIGFDESTSFRRGGRGRRGTGEGADAASATPPAPAAGAESDQSITLADIKVGDTVRGTGSLKNGVFVPAQLVVMSPGQGRGSGGRYPGGGGGSPASASPHPET